MATSCALIHSKKKNLIFATAKYSVTIIRM
jgi:hypothetical protein